MNRRGFFQTVTVAIAAMFSFAKKAKATPVCATMGTAWVTLSYNRVIPSLGNMSCPFCDNIIAIIGEGGLYPITLYCEKCKIGFNKFENVRNYWAGGSRTEVEYIYESQEFFPDYFRRNLRNLPAQEQKG